MSLGVDTALLPDPDATGGTEVVIRRSVLLSGVVGGLATLLGVAYLVRATSVFETVLGLLLVGLAALHLPALASARIPVVVADTYGIRFRVGLTWRGLPWSDVRQVVVEYADSPLGEGRMVVVPRDPESVLDCSGELARTHLRWNRLWYGAPLSIPLGMTTAVDVPDLAAGLKLLAAGRAEVVNLRGRDLAHLDDVPSGHRLESTADATPPVVAAGDLVADDELAPGVVDGVVLHEAPVEPEPVLESSVLEQPVPDEDGEPEFPRAPVLPAPVSALREVSRPARVEVRLDPLPVPEQREAALQDTWNYREPVEPAVETPWVEPPREAVIGRKILHAREMLDMSIDELSQRTRIRPHVLEAIELDDFGPCGGDFYARGHLTAISRTLGLTLDPLLKVYDERYAQAPINARRVFEAELSTGLSGGMRATLGGPRWSLLIGSVLSLTMIWGLARMFAGEPEQLTAAPDSSGQSAGLAANRTPITSPMMKTTPMTVTAAHAATRVVVRDRTGRVLWSGDLALGSTRKVVGLAPFQVTADNAGAVVVSVKGKPLGTIGTAGTKDTKQFG
jgi:cytoskeletal protein RodZ/phage shock protein PspC (stress-responsive transcriptional regulator)